MKSSFMAMFILLITINANCYYPLFLAQDDLEQFTEKLIIQVNDVTSEILPEKESELFNFYRVKLTVEIKFIGKTNSGLNKNDIIIIYYQTSELKPSAGKICLYGYIPIKVPNQQDLCIMYLDKNYTFDKHWALQILTDDIAEAILSDKPTAWEKTPEWVKSGVKQLQVINSDS